MDYILECEIKPFAFTKITQFFKQQENDTPCYYNVLKDPKLEYYSDKN